MDGRGDIHSRNQLEDDMDLTENNPLATEGTRLSPPPTYTDVVGCGMSDLEDLRGPDVRSMSGVEASRPRTEESSQSTEEASLTTQSSGSVRSTTPLIYKIRDNPPIYLTVVFAFQQALLAFATQLIISLLVAQAVQGEHDPVLRGKLLGSTMFMCGFTTLAMSLFGVRLPLFQGGAAEYIIPLLVLQDAGQDGCGIATTTGTTRINSTSAYVDSESRLFYSNDTQYQLMSNITAMVDGAAPCDNQGVDFHKLRGMMGSLMIAGAVHSLIGATGLVGLLLRYVGPITVVPSLLLVGLWMAKSVAKLVSVHWGIGTMTAAISIILSLYLGKWKMPIPFWSMSKGIHIIRSSFHQTAGILIGLLSGWALCGILTAYDAFSDDPKAPDYFARTDIMPGVIQNASWIYLPYPGQFGKPSFSGKALIGFLIATLISVLDSIADYYACAMACNVPPPPAHAVNRGIAVEGFCSFLSGTLGCGHATGSYGGNIGAIRITKVASRRVFMMVGLLFMLFGIVGKICALFITIPYPVLGGSMLIMVSMFIGVVFANLQHVDLSSNRNLAILGISITVGSIVPYWVERNPHRLKTGNDVIDQLIGMLLGNAVMSGALLACILDNTLAGSRAERGLTTWENVTSHESDEPSDVKGKEEMTFTEGMEIYEPLVPKCVRGWKGFRYIPFMPDTFSGTEHEMDK